MGFLYVRFPLLDDKLLSGMQLDTREPSFLLKASVQFPSPSPQVKTWGDFVFVRPWGLQMRHGSPFLGYLLFIFSFSPAPLC